MDIKEYRQATINAVKFLLSQQNSDGSFTPVESGVSTFSKVPFALSVMGQVDRAGRLCAYITENVVDEEEGDLVGHFPRTPMAERFYLVPNAWVIAGAQRLGQFGVSLRSIDFLGGLQHKSGGFFSAGPAATRESEQDVMTTAIAGLALLYCGRLEDAELAGNYLSAVWDAQPSAGTKLLFTTRNGNQLVTDYTPEQEAMFCVAAGKKDQWVHVPALAAGFLTLLSQATGNKSYMKTANLYLQFVDGCGEDRSSAERGPFVGWAAGLLYQATGNQNYRRLAVEVADAMLGNQLANGSWLKASMGEDLESDVIDGTAENLIAMVQIIEGLSAGE